MTIETDTPLTINIKVSGRSNSGKTTIAYVITRALKEAGFEVDAALQDVTYGDKTLREYSNEAWKLFVENIDNRIQSVKRKTKIVVSQEQVRREIEQ